MFRNICILSILLSVVLFLFGLFNLSIDVEDNRCRMTFMFGRPQFARVPVKENNEYPNYGLYYYYEGSYFKKINDIKLFGAPVIFVPGNGGSMKQVRSLASVALRKSFDSNVKLDYFTIDFNEELSGLFGTYLNKQKEFLQKSIETVVSLYKGQPKVTLIGHSMGGVLSKAMLVNETIALNVECIILMSSPNDRPVLNLDYDLNNFYKETNSQLSKKRSSFNSNFDTNFCNCYASPNPKKVISSDNYSSFSLDNVFITSIGGGNRDLLVRDELTFTTFADIHAMTSSIPEVWLSCDHLSVVWCLQLMIIINRFLFAITEEKHGSFQFSSNKTKKWQTAMTYFVSKNPSFYTNYKEVKVLQNKSYHKWNENNLRVFSKRYSNGIKEHLFEYFNLSRFQKYDHVYIQMKNFDDSDWLYGCCSDLDPKIHSCGRTISLQKHHLIQPSGSETTEANVNLTILREKFNNLNYVFIKMPLTNKKILLSTDFYQSQDRQYYLKFPSILDYKKHILLNETMQGTLYYKIQIAGLQDTFQSILLNVRANACYEESYSVTLKICIPWTPGFDRYHVLSKEDQNGEIFIYAPIAPPSGYNTSVNPITVEIFLDPACRFQITYQYSLANTMSRLIKEYYSWLPSHVVAVILIILRDQIGVFVAKEKTHTLRPFTTFFQYKSLYLITGCRLIKKLLVPVHLYSEDSTINSYIVLIMIHSIAIVGSIVSSILIWSIMLFNSNLFSKFVRRYIKISFNVPSLLESAINYVPISFGFLGVAVALMSGGGMAIFFGSGLYFLMISNAFKDYLEDHVWKKATNFVRKHLSEQRVDRDDDQNSQAVIKLEKRNEDSIEYCEGLDSFSYHYALFILLIIMSILQGPGAIAWIKDRRISPNLLDPSLHASIIALFSLAVLLQMGAPTRQIYGNRIMKCILYISASVCIIFCQETLYILNWIIAFVFIMLVFHEFLGLIFKKFISV